MRIFNCNKTFFMIGCLALASFLPAFAQRTEIQVLSATVKDKVVPDAQVIFQKNGETSVTATTDSRGKISIASPFGGADDNNVTLIIKKQGYSTLVTKGPINGLTYALSPTMQTLDGLRIVLSWNDDPQDLDSHLSYPGNHIWFGQKTGSQANLDVDDTDGYGPETVTIERKEPGQKYLYAVHDYTDMSKTGNTNLSVISGAKVFVYVGNTLIKTYNVPQGGQAGNTWMVFMIDENGSFEDINQFKNATSPESLHALLERSRGNQTLGTEPVVSQQSIAESARINRKGEEAYKAGNLEGSVALYQEAIERNGNNGQAYSNLGLSFQKLGRIAEAIWANRKAIDLANGPNTSTIQARSYFNIAKIYENKSQWADALQNYTWARDRKQHSAYDGGIQRMKAKLNQ